MSNDNQSTRSERHNNNDNQQRNVGGLIKKILLWVAGIVVLLMVASAALFFYYASSAPKISRSDLTSQSITTIYDDQNRVISRLGAQKREYAKDNQIPKQLKNAVVSIEDRRFYKHHGVDTIRILGAATSNVFGRSAGMQGGSTLTQQLVKLSVFSTAASDRTLKRKAQEAWLAINVEQHFSKSQILDFYINKVYMGNGIYGMQTAAQYYYGKDLNDLDLSQLALLAGMPQSPTYYDPTAYPAYAKSRRDLVLQAMYDNKAITKEQETAAMNVNIKSGLSSAGQKSLAAQQYKSKVADAYITEVKKDLVKKGYDPATDNLKVYTNLNMNAQQRLFDIANTSKYVNYPNNRFQLGVSVVDSYTGKISAMIGGRKHTDVTYGLNRAVQKDRSNASTMKPILDYGPAIEYDSWPTYKTVADTKYKYPGTDITVNDFDNRHLGNMTMRQALVQSRNIPAVRTLEAVGVTRAKEFANSLGMGLNHVVYSNAIGAEVSSLQVAGAYAAFANGGTYHKPYYINKIVTPDNKTTNFDSTGTRVMKQSTAYIITDMLKGVINSATGTGTTAKIGGVYQAGKTGTSNYEDKYKDKVPSDAEPDSWMAGYTKNYSVSVWTGYDTPGDFSKVNYIDNTTSKISQDIYREMMTYLQEHSPNSDWSKPSSVGTVKKNGIEELYVVGHLFSNSEAASGTSSKNNVSSSAVSSSAEKESSSSHEESSEESSKESSSEESSKESSSEESSSAESSHEESSSSEASSESSSAEKPATDTNNDHQENN